MYSASGCGHDPGGIVFDMNGLLFDSERIVQRAWEEAGKALGIPCMGEHICQTPGMNRKGRNEYFTRAIGEDLDGPGSVQRPVGSAEIAGKT